MIPYNKREGKIWYNNDLVDWQEAKLHVLSHGLHYGSFVFEGLRVYGGEIFKLEDHTERLFHSAKIMFQFKMFKMDMLDLLLGEEVK